MLALYDFIITQWRGDVTLCSVSNFLFNMLTNNARDNVNVSKMCTQMYSFSLNYLHRVDIFGMIFVYNFTSSLLYLQMIRKSINNYYDV